MRRSPPNLVPLPGGIRPGESLWSIVNRLIWLNRPGIDELIDVFKVRRQRWPDLLVGGDSDTSLEAAKSRFLIPLIAMTARQFEVAILPRYLESPRRLVYCQSCALAGYHSVVFQLPGVSSCPIHSECLLNRCPVCGARIATTLNPATVNNPYGCASCGASLIKSRMDFFRGSLPGDPAGLRRITHWMRQLTRQVLAWGDLHTAYHYRTEPQEAAADGAQLAAVAASCARRAPPSLDLLKKVGTQRASFFFPFSAQQPPAADKRANRPAFAGGEESVRIYRAYLKSLRQRYFSPAFQKALHRQDFSLWSAPILRRFPFEVAVAYAILLLRLRVEGWPSTDPLRKDPERYLRYNQVRSRDQKRGYTLVLPRSSSDRQDDGVRIDLKGIANPLRAWIIAHWQLMEYTALFSEALLFAREQLTQGHFESAPHLEGRLIPTLFVLTRDDAAGAFRLDFWGRGQVDRSAYEAEREAVETKEAYYSRLVNSLR